MIGLWYIIAIELDSERASVTIVGEEPCPILAHTRLLNQQLVRRTANEEHEIGLSIVGSVSKSTRRVDFVDLKLLFVAPCR